jgi:opacity protein-like surface antigen
MMNKSILVSLILALCLTSVAVNAQNLDYRSTLSTPIGLNGWQIVALTDDIISADTVIGAYMKASPTLGLSYDLGLAKWFSLGLQFTWNRGRIGADDLTVTVKDKAYTGAVELNLRRLNFGLRPLIHYANNGRFDCYSGFRIGVNYIRTKVSVGTEEDITDSELINRLLGNNWLLNRNYRNVRPTIQVIPFGMRWYFTPQLGLGFESTAGATYFFCAQLDYRF